MQITFKHIIAPLTICLAFALSACERSKIENADKLSPEDQIMQTQVEQAALQPFEMTADDPHDIQLLMDYEQRHDQMSNDLEDELKRLHENKQLDDLINYKWILFLLIFLLGLEWLLRKRAGTY